jgi:hypothetical protein
MNPFVQAWWLEQQAKADLHREAIRRRERLLDWLSWGVFVGVSQWGAGRRQKGKT